MIMAVGLATFSGLRSMRWNRIEGRTNLIKSNGDVQRAPPHELPQSVPATLAGLVLSIRDSILIFDNQAQRITRYYCTVGIVLRYCNQVRSADIGTNMKVASEPELLPIRELVMRIPGVALHRCKLIPNSNELQLNNKAEADERESRVLLAMVHALLVLYCMY